MAITSAICNSFKTEILKAVHNFTATTGNDFNIAVYTSAATLGAGTTAYSSSNEITNSSGCMYIAPTPDANYKFRIYYNKMPNGLGSGTGFNNNTYLSTYFPQGLLYACLVEAFAFLKGPTDMLTYYENRYKNAIQQFAGMQLGRRRRDDYTDGTVRIQVKSPSP